MMPPVPVHVRPATRSDAAATLLYRSAAPYYDRFAGSQGDALRILSAVWPKPGHTASWELCLVAEDDDAVLGVLAGFPVSYADRLVRAFMRVALPRVRPWRLPGTIGHLRAASRVSPVPPPGSWYVDALAVDPAAERRGIATALLDAAADRARATGSSALALDTSLDNTGAQRLYEARGFSERGRLPAPDAATERALGGPGFVSYARPL